MKKLVVGILAHVDSGKTTLSEAMLYTAGKIRKLGRVDHKDAYLDTDAQERERGITIFSKQAVFTYDGMEITLLDTPGHVDFSAEMERTLQVLDYAILVINGVDGVQSHTDTLWKLLKRYEIPTFIFVNKMDMDGADKDAVFQNIRKKLDGDCVDFSSGDRDEQIAMADERLLDTYLDSGMVEVEDIIEAILDRKIFPCFWGSALKLSGVQELLDAMNTYMVMPAYNAEFGGRIFKISRDAKGERLTYMKVTGGSLKCREQIEGTEGKVNQIRIYSGARYETVEEASAGTVCAVTGLGETSAGQGVGCEQENVFAGLEPVLSYKVSYPEDKDAVVVLRDIRQLEEEEPELHVEFAQETGEIFVKVMGQVQLQVLTQIVKDRFGYLISFGMGRIIYKETLAEPVMGVGHFEPLRHYAEVHLLMEPLEPGSGMQFDTICSEDVLDKNWQRLILTHLEEKEYRGVLTGAPITDMKITVTAGRAHQKHTEGGDFRQATYRAVRQGLMMGECRLLEPVYAFRLEIPTEMTGRAMNDITRMHGRFAQPEIEGEMSILTGTAPVATMQEYQQDVTAYTRGQGKLSCTLQGYEPCHNEDEVLAASTYDPELDLANPASSVFCAHGAGYIVDWYDVYDMMHVKEDPGFALAGMEDVLRNITSEPTEADEDNRKRMARERQDAGVPVYDEKELEDIFVRTYGSNSRENAAYNKAGFNRYNKGVSEADWYVKKAAGHGKSKTAGAQTLSAGSKTADTGIARPGAYRKQKGEKEYLLVDGYNVIFAWDDLKALAAVNIDSARDKLIDIMSNYQGYVGCELILVFDAYKVKQNPGSITKHGNIHVVYTKEAETADMYIEKTTHELGRKYKVTVASSDGLEQLIIMGQGALRMSSRGLREEVERVNQILRNDYLK
ncbi:TetM/TetW/TetO/TetS family tetracycline resistance ribosomal protection protein [Coprococcus eutactus]|uniref:translation factor GTPase family protein n=1 Tax=Clostridia TaxID=186801 RepID=UPI00033BFB79|nr:MULTISPECIES: TetM/TetW/TetO/TetS family tetracycline resistance ribosomal protection protein [Clostridia]MCB5504549.1 TetM/TetW/TetO/TetS family tetracycline resistance ribosomal protection protein [Coprococcus eutactus]CCY60805.1 putative translation elongation factor G [Clostridium sp. CAG:264]